MTPDEKAAAVLASAARAAERRRRLIAARDLPYEQMLAETDRLVLEEAGFA